MVKTWDWTLEGHNKKNWNYQFLGIIFLLVNSLWCLLPHCWSCDDTNEQDSTPAESMACRKDENVLEEECIQLG